MIALPQVKDERANEVKVVPPGSRIAWMNYWFGTTASSSEDTD